jgi:hypothetical protein
MRLIGAVLLRSFPVNDLKGHPGGGPHLEAALDAEAADLLHEQEDAVAARHDVVLDLAELHLCKVLHAAPQPVKSCVPDR